MEKITLNGFDENNEALRKILSLEYEGIITFKECFCFTPVVGPKPSIRTLESKNGELIFKYSKEVIWKTIKEDYPDLSKQNLSESLVLLLHCRNSIDIGLNISESGNILELGEKTQSEEEFENKIDPVLGSKDFDFLVKDANVTINFGFSVAVLPTMNDLIFVNKRFKNVDRLEISDFMYSIIADAIQSEFWTEKFETIKENLNEFIEKAKKKADEKLNEQGFYCTALIVVDFGKCED